MKLPLLLVALLGLAESSAQAQNRKRVQPLPVPDSALLQPVRTGIRTFEPRQLLPSYAVELAYNKTTSLIFPAAVRSVDLGSRDVLADKAGEVENVLRVKSARIGFNETNFSVMTADGRFYSFVASYNEAPQALAVVVSTQPAPSFDTDPATPGVRSRADNDRVEFQKLGTDQRTVVTRSGEVLRARVRNLASVRRQRMRGRVGGFFVDGELMYLRLQLRNQSNIPFDVGSVRFFASDRKKAREAALQELEVVPLSVQPAEFRRVGGAAVAEAVFVFSKFTLGSRQRLRLLVEEKNGHRTLDWSLSPRQVLRARNFSSSNRVQRWFGKR
jgi:conjugative transposon TraN protein